MYVALTTYPRLPASTVASHPVDYGVTVAATGLQVTYYCSRVQTRLVYPNLLYVRALRVV